MHFPLPPQRNANTPDNGQLSTKIKILRTFVSLIPLSFAIIGTFLSVHKYQEYLLVKEQSTWKPVECVIKNVESLGILTSSGKFDAKEHLKVTYVFSLDGKEIESSSTEKWPANRYKKTDHRVRIGRKTKCYISPDSPIRTTLSRGAEDDHIRLLGPLFIVIGTAGFIVFFPFGAIVRRKIMSILLFR